MRTNPHVSFAQRLLRILILTKMKVPILQFNKKEQSKLWFLSTAEI